jgi:hypothetical protein
MEGVVVFVVDVELCLKVYAKKSIFICSYTQKKKSSSQNQQRVRSQIDYLKNASFLYVFDLLISHKAHNKEHKNKIEHFLICL